MKKSLSIGVILLFLLSALIPVSLGINIDNIMLNQSLSNFNNWDNIFYVGGNGPGNYSKIQDAIDNASEGDTIYVYDDSSPYYENIFIESYESSLHYENLRIYLHLMGENKDTTVIDGSNKDRSVIYNQRPISVSGFTIRNSGNKESRAGIYCQCGGNSITDNNIIHNQNGIRIDGGSYNIITNNLISNNEVGICIYDGGPNSIYHNNFINNTQHTEGGYNHWDDGHYGNYWDDYREKYPDAKESILIPGTWNTPYEIYFSSDKDRHPLINQWPSPKPRTITRDIPIYDSLLLRFFNGFPLLKEVFLRLIR